MPFSILGLISSLRTQMENMQKVKERAEKIARDAVAEAKGLREPLEAAIVDNKELKRQMANYDRDKAALAVSATILYAIHTRSTNPQIGTQYQLSKFIKNN